MKKFLLFIFIIPFCSFGQTVVWSDNFDDEDISDWTLIDADGDGRKWGDAFAINNASGIPVTPISLISRSWQTIALTPDNYAISPAIDLSGASGLIELKYTTQVAAAAWDEEVLSVYISTGTDVASILASTLTTTTTLGDAANSGAPTPHVLDISSFAGQSAIYVVFRHHDCTDQDFLSVDDVMVEAASVLGVDDISQNENLSVLYPNPVESNFNLKLSDSFNKEKTTVTLTDLSGKIVFNKPYSENMNVENIAKGVYVMTISDGSNTENQKLIKK